MREAEQKFHDRLSRYVSGNAPYSFLACVSAFPLNSENFYDTIDRNLLISLLSDRGFLFLEARPHGQGQYSMRELSSILQPISERYRNGTQHAIPLATVEWTESEMIDEAVKRITNEFRRQDESANSFPKILLRSCTNRRKSSIIGV